MCENKVLTNAHNVHWSGHASQMKCSGGEKRLLTLFHEQSKCSGGQKSSLMLIINDDDVQLKIIVLPPPHPKFMNRWAQKMNQAVY